MLPTIGRAAIRRVVGRGPQSTNSALRSLWHLQYTGTFHDPNSSSALSKSSSSLGRCYATATKAASKPKATTAKTANPKKKAVAKKAVKKPVKKLAKKKVVKKLKPKLKPKPKGRPKKILTPEEAKKAAARQVVKEQKAKALSPPKNLPQTAWTVLASEWAKAHPEGKPSPLIGASAKYKSLSPAELEQYNHVANQNKAANAIAYKQWVESHTPEQIRLANNARTQLRTKDPLHTWKPIHDDRRPKRPSTPMVFFAKERYASGDLKGIPLGDNSRLVSREWAALSPSDRKAYEDLAIADRQRYAQEFKTVFHRDPDFIAKQKAA